MLEPNAASAAPSVVSVWNLLLRLSIVLACVGAILFGAAGRTDVVAFWAYLFLMLIFVVVAFFAVLLPDPDFMRERFRRGAGDEDRYTRALMLPIVLGCWVTAGLDVRWGWSGNMPPAVQVAAFGLFALGLCGWIWPMSVNRYFSGQVRLQPERGHRVVSAGPYRFVRHPGYTALLLIFLVTPIALGSWYALIPVVPVLPLFIWRTRLEDRMLHHGLAGYADYAARVRYRLLPGIW